MFDSRLLPVGEGSTRLVKGLRHVPHEDINAGVMHLTSAWPSRCFKGTRPISFLAHHDPIKGSTLTTYCTSQVVLDEETEHYLSALLGFRTDCLIALFHYPLSLRLSCSWKNSWRLFFFLNYPYNLYSPQIIPRYCFIVLIFILRLFVSTCVNAFLLNY